MEYTELLPKKPETVALSFSGGGFRAASFCLGCLSYLEHLKLGEKKFTELINFISSASGGSFTNLAYTSGQRKGENFSQFYRRMNSEALKGELVVNRVFEILNDKKIWKSRHFKTRNIINAFAIAYDEIIFKGDTFAIYYNAPSAGVPEVCVNATEFDNGMLFRFQNAGQFGNFFLHSINKFEPTQRLKMIKLGDVVAASSCFTVGFEPIMFPNDFSYQGLSPEELQNDVVEDTRFNPIKENGEKNPIAFGLMDGGIDDNQGIDSFIRAEERLQRRNKFGHDLYIACDVSSNYTGGYNFPEENKSNIFEKPSLLQYIGLFFLLFLFSLAGLYMGFNPGLFYSFLGATGLVVLLIIFFLYKVVVARKKAIEGKSTYGKLIFKHIGFFLKIRLRMLLQLVDARLTSAGYLAATVFLKKIRRISYDWLFEKISELKFNADGKLLYDDQITDQAVDMIKLKHWKKFSLQNAIYLLSKKNDEQRNLDLKKEPWYDNPPRIDIVGKLLTLIEFLQPSDELQEIASTATSMDTTLWFDDTHQSEKQPEKLIATGQFTTCYNMLKYSFRNDWTDSDWKVMQQNLISDWSRFKGDPLWLFKQFESTTNSSLNRE
ncbi:MAG: patatin-like phospholipase family protein [Bacteroidetes bacterium]|nr:patatin-like phospholipase family protein [Bacteroidota bacterium]